MSQVNSIHQFTPKISPISRHVLANKIRVNENFELLLYWGGTFFISNKDMVFHIGQMILSLNSDDANIAAYNFRKYLDK